MAQTVRTDNLTQWAQGNIARAYRSTAGIFPAEEAQLQAIGSQLEDFSVLDIGIGTGRTTSFLMDACRTYVGVDYSQAMVDRAKARFPGRDIRLADARKLSDFATGSFDLVVFSFNGIDYVGHEDRQKILSEIRRVLRHEGLFSFSTHRLGVDVPQPASLQNLRLSLNPARTALGAVRYLRGIKNSRALQPQQEWHGEYALLNDPAHEYRLLTYYITPLEQAKQLRQAGFELDRAFRMNGETIIAADLSNDGFGDDFMVHYLAFAPSRSAS